MTDRSAELTWNVFVTLPLLTLVDEPPEHVNLDWTVCLINY
jgi:hypothetical protein